MINIPDNHECYILLSKYHVPKNIIKHSEQVQKIAVYLASRLNKAGEHVNVKLVSAAALLHDIARPVDFKNYDNFNSEDVKVWKNIKRKYSGKHDIVGYNLLKDTYPEVAKIIKCHAYMTLTTKDAPKTWEEKIVNYADKRVSHEKIVTLKERFSEGKLRWKKEYPEKEERDTILVDRIHRKAEKEIFDKVQQNPEKLKNYIIKHNE